METRRKEITKADLQKTLSLDSLYENISLEKTIPEFIDRLRDNHVGVRQLLTAIQTGDSDAKIFDQDNCYLYLLYLQKHKMISDEVFLTVHFYLLALMQYTYRQPIKADDYDVKLVRDFSVDKLVEDGKLTPEAFSYIATLTNRFADLGFSIDQVELRKYILSLPPTEQWLLRIKSVKKLPDNYHVPIRGTDYYSSESLQALSCVNLPFVVLTSCDYLGDAGAVKKKNTSFWMPSASIIQYALCVVSPHPVCMKPSFGTTTLEKLHDMHAISEHPVVLYSRDINSNMYDVDRYRSGAFVAALHDVGHTFYGSLLKVSERQIIFSCLIPFVKAVREEWWRRDGGSTKELLGFDFFDYMIERIGDYDLTPIWNYYNPDTRFKDYFKHSLEHAFKFPVFHRKEYELMYQMSRHSSYSTAQREWIKLILPPLPLKHEPSVSLFKRKRDEQDSTDERSTKEMRIDNNI